jgi:hypothetical protein
MALLAAYVLAVGFVVAPWSMAATQADDAICRGAAEASHSAPAQPRDDHSGCSLCSCGCAVGGPALDRAAGQVIVAWPASVHMAGRARAVAPSPRLRGTAGLARAPPQSA